MTFTNGKYCPNVTFDSISANISLNHIASMGTNYISVVVTQYQPYANSTYMYPIYGTPYYNDGQSYITATPQELEVVINRAHKLNIGVMLKPHIDLTNDSPGVWRGNIGTGFNDSQWQEWFTNYEKYILFYANLSQVLKVEMFSVSCELIVASEQTQYWRSLIPKIRSVYDYGLLTSSANGDSLSDEVIVKEWWDLMDIIGCDCYYINQQYDILFTNNTFPNLTQIIQAWQPLKDALYNLTIVYNKSLLFTEIGYCNGYDGQCYANGDVAPFLPTNETQENMKTHYQAALETFGFEEWFKGVFWWNWATDAAFGGWNNSCMTPSYKPTESLLREWYDATEPIPNPPDFLPLCACIL